MKHEENEDRTQTLTNPYLQKNRFNNLENINPSHFQSFLPDSENSLMVREETSRLKFEHDQIHLNNFESIQMKLSSQNGNIEKFDDPIRHEPNNYDAHNTDVEEDYSFEDEFEDKFILAGADLEKTFFTLTIEEKKLMHIESNEVISSRQRIEESSNCEKMQIEDEISQKLPLKVEQNPEENQENEDPFEYRQEKFSFSLKDSREIRQIRFLTPIKSLKRFILRKFGYSEGARNCENLQISFFNLYPNQSPFIIFPIIDEENLELLVLEFIKARRDLFIRFENDGSLRKKVERKNGRNQEQFDSDGELQESESEKEEVENEEDADYRNAREMIKVNKTEKSRYKGTKLVRCAFCHKTNKDIENIKICGPFYGPFLRGKIKTKHYTHLLCAVWCKKVYLEEKDDELKKIPDEINRSQRKNCKYCDKKGAGLLCHGCGSSMHYECGLGKCEYVWAKYELFCDKCHEKRQKEIEKDLEDEFEENELIEIESSNQENFEENIHSISISEKQQICNLSISQPLNVNGFYDSSLEEELSKTQSLKKSQLKKEEENLKIDRDNRIEVINESSDLEILEEKHKPPKNKELYEVKIEEDSSSLKEKEKPRRGRRPKKNN